MNTNIGKTTAELRTKPTFRRHPTTRVSRGGLNEINPDDIIYGEYAGGDKNHGNWIDLVYLDDDILRTYSGSVSPPHPIIEELKVLLRDEDIFYLVPVKEFVTCKLSQEYICDNKSSKHSRYWASLFSFYASATVSAQLARRITIGVIV